MCCLLGFLVTISSLFDMFLFSPLGRLEIEGSGKTWRQDQRIRLQHVDTGGYLHSHDKKYTRIAGGQQEVSSRLYWHRDSSKYNSYPIFCYLDSLKISIYACCRFAVLKKNVQIMFGWQQRVSTSQLLKKASKDCW